MQAARGATSGRSCFFDKQPEERQAGPHTEEDQRHPASYIVECISNRFLPTNSEGEHHLSSKAHSLALA
jgi:hypothetical protein